LLQAPAAKVVETQSVAPVVMADLLAGLALVATLGDCFPSVQPMAQKLCVREELRYWAASSTEARVQLAAECRDEFGSRPALAAEA